MNIDKNVKNAFLAASLHRLRVLISNQADELFSKYNLMTPSSCVSTMLYLEGISEASIASISKETDYSHQLVNQRLKKLERFKLIKRSPSIKDKRKKTISLTAKGEMEVKKIRELLVDISGEFESIFKELGVDLIEVTKKFSASLGKYPLRERL